MREKHGSIADKFRLIYCQWLCLDTEVGDSRMVHHNADGVEWFARLKKVSRLNLAGAAFLWS